MVLDGPRTLLGIRPRSRRSTAGSWRTSLGHPVRRPRSRVSRRSVRNRGAFEHRSRHIVDGTARPSSGPPRRSRSAVRSADSCPGCRSRRDRRARVPDAQRVGARRRLDGALPVLVWFPGGAFAIGASSQPVYDGARLARGARRRASSPCNYRLGALGFLDARDVRRRRELRAPRRDRARSSGCATTSRSFGGDPGRVVTCSASRPAAAWCCTRSRRRPLAGCSRGAIVQSGATFNTLDDKRAALVVRRRSLAEARRERRRRLCATLPVDAI